MRCTQFRINAAHGLTEFGTKLLLGATFARHDVHLGTSKPRFLPQSKNTQCLYHKYQSIHTVEGDIYIYIMFILRTIKSRQKQTNTLRAENPELLHVKAGGTFSTHSNKRSAV